MNSGGLNAFAGTDEFILPIPIRNGSVIVRVVVPKDITPEEARRVGLVLHAFTSDAAILSSEKAQAGGRGS